MTPAERNAVLEEAAQWHDRQASEADARGARAVLWEAIRRNNLIADIHEQSAIAIRGLKEQEPTT